jgi:hypothetical protein
MAALTTIAVGALAAGSIVAGNEARKSSNYYNRLAAEEQKKAQDIAQKRNEFNAARERRSQIARARVAPGEVAAGIGAAGVQGSGATFGLAAAQGQAGANIGFLNQQQGFNTAIGDKNQNAAYFQQQGAVKAGRLNFLSSVFQTGATLGASFSAPSSGVVDTSPTGPAGNGP